MRTNIEIDDALMAEAMTLSGAKTKKAVVELALQSLIERVGRRTVLDSFGTFEWEGDLEAMRLDTPTSR